MKNGFRFFRRALKNLFLPPCCLCCSSRETISDNIFFCQGCFDRLAFSQKPICPCCGKIYSAAAGIGHHCPLCLKEHWHFSRARALFIYEDPVQVLIRRFKYQGQFQGLSTLYHLKRKMVTGLMEPDVIIPVPLHVDRLKERGFNQALILAEKLFPEIHHTLQHSLLIRLLRTPPQTSLSAGERRKNLKNAFAVRDKETVSGRNILLVDDVFTTGATVNECARTLKQAGAAHVQVFTLARVRN